MSDSDNSCASCEYEMYKREFLEDEDRFNERPSLIRTKSRLIAAVVQNEVEILQDLLTSPKWYNVRDYWGYSLLQIAIMKNNVDVFDYMLSLPNFPLEYENQQNGETALLISLEFYIDEGIPVDEHFSYELIKKGARIDRFGDDGNTLLHCAVKNRFFKTAELLIQKGVDVNFCNDRGETPLDVAVDYGDYVPRLLMLGAEPKISNFERAIFMADTEIVQETLFLYLFDEFSRHRMRLDAILKLACTNVPLFYDLLKFSVTPVIDFNNALDSFTWLLKVPTSELKVILEKFSNELQMFSSFSECERSWRPLLLSLENLDLILQSDIGSSFINFDSSSRGSKIGYHLTQAERDEQRVTERYCLLLSYNMKVTEYDVALIYQRFGYCELFKILLHMDIEAYAWGRVRIDFMPLLIYNVKIDIETFLRNPTQYSEKSVEELMNYFAHPRLREMHCERVEHRLVRKKESLPEIPSLVEIARNEFRKYFIKKLNVKSSKMFYTYLNCLSISNVHKKIISYETKLY